MKPNTLQVVYRSKRHNTYLYGRVMVEEFKSVLDGSSNFWTSHEDQATEQDNSRFADTLERLRDEDEGCSDGKDL